MRLAKMYCVILTVCFAATVAWAQNNASSVRIRLYQGDVGNFIQSSLSEAESLIFKSTKYNPTQKTVFIIHGLASSAESDAVKLPAKAFLNKFQMNVIGVDWRKLALQSDNQFEQALYFIQYPTAAGNTQIVGKAIANLINGLVSKSLLSLDNLILVGHSLGAQTCGVIGRNLASKPPLIIGCDAAMPLFDEEFNTYTPLTRNDAAVVHLVHTDGGVLGTNKAQGTASFFVNRGIRSQPGCGYFGIETSCSHGRSYEYLAEAILNPTSFPAVKCDVILNFIVTTCSSNYIYFGYPPNLSASGRYYLDTNSKSNFGKGLDGLNGYKK